MQDHMRTFKDSTGVEWTVFEVRRQAKDDGQWSYLPQGFNSGWLCFESLASKRRLTPVPEGWRDLRERQLEDLLWKAVAVSRPRYLGTDPVPNEGSWSGEETA
jgi:hypothetical protein